MEDYVAVFFTTSAEEGTINFKPSQCDKAQPMGAVSAVQTANI